MPVTKTESGLWVAKASDARLTSASSRDALAALAVYRSLVLNDGAVAYFRLAEASGLVANDATGNFVGTISATGITYGVASALQGDPADRAMGFNGSTGKIDLPYNALLNPAVFSIEGWFNGGPNGNCPMWECRPASSGATAAGFDLFIGTSGPNPTAGFSICSNNVAQTIITGALTLNTWQHIIGTYDGTQSRLYVNGVLRSGPTTCPFTPNPSRTVGIGHLNAGGNFLTGLLDENALYPLVLNGNQAQNHWLAGSVALGAIATARESLV